MKRFQFAAENKKKMNNNCLVKYVMFSVYLEIRFAKLIVRKKKKQNEHMDQTN